MELADLHEPATPDLELRLRLSFQLFHRHCHTARGDFSVTYPPAHPHDARNGLSAGFCRLDHPDHHPLLQPPAGLVGVEPLHEDPGHGAGYLHRRPQPPGSASTGAGDCLLVCILWSQGGLFHHHHRWTVSRSRPGRILFPGQQHPGAGPHHVVAPDQLRADGIHQPLCALGLSCHQSPVDHRRSRHLFPRGHGGAGGSAHLFLVENASQVSGVAAHAHRIAGHVCLHAEPMALTHEPGHRIRRRDEARSDIGRTTTC